PDPGGFVRTVPIGRFSFGAPRGPQPINHSADFLFGPIGIPMQTCRSPYGSEHMDVRSVDHSQPDSTIIPRLARRCAAKPPRWIVLRCRHVWFLGCFG